VSETIFIDTLYVIALTNRRDQYHARAAELAERYEGRQFLTTDAVLVEIGNGLARNFKTQATAIIDHFLTSADVDVVRMTPGLFAEAFLLYQTYHDKEWGLTDCISFVAMRNAKVDAALTFDQHFTQAGFRALMRPDE
jgi:predicted nucleic acid-binding protein